MSKKRILASTLTIIVIVGLILSITLDKSTKNSRKKSYATGFSVPSLKGCFE